MTDMDCLEVYYPSEFEDALHKFQKSYKEALVKQKIRAIDEDFK